MEEFRPGASIFQGKETGPHPGEGTEPCQEAHSAAAADGSCRRLMGRGQGGVARLPAGPMAGDQCSGAIPPARGSQRQAWADTPPFGSRMAVGTCLRNAGVAGGVSG